MIKLLYYAPKSVKYTISFTEWCYTGQPSLANMILVWKLPCSTNFEKYAGSPARRGVCEQRWGWGQKPPRTGRRPTACGVPLGFPPALQRWEALGPSASSASPWSPSPIVLASLFSFPPFPDALRQMTWTFTGQLDLGLRWRAGVLHVSSLNPYTLSGQVRRLLFQGSSALGPYSQGVWAVTMLLSVA